MSIKCMVADLVPESQGDLCIRYRNGMVVCMVVWMDFTSQPICFSLRLRHEYLPDINSIFTLGVWVFKVE